MNLEQFERHDFWTDAELCSAWDQVNRLWSLTGHFYDMLLWSLAVCSGLRRAELMSLRVEDCDPPALHVRRGKGGKSRDVEVVPEFLYKFNDRISVLRNEGYIWVFQSPLRRKPMSLRRANYLWNEAIATLKLRNYWIDEDGEVRPMGVHAGRRTFATMARLLWYETGNGQQTRISLEDLKAQLGHTKIETTLRYYARSLVGNRWVPRALEWPKHV